jgi:hypothetical protein
MAKTPLTPPRKRALSILLDTALHDPHPLRISNQMTSELSIYWQVAEWLIANGLAERVAHDYIQLTAAGRDVALDTKEA